jgi:hypothetical protein
MGSFSIWHWIIVLVFLVGPIGGVAAIIVLLSRRKK